MQLRLLGWGLPLLLLLALGPAVSVAQQDTGDSYLFLNAKNRRFNKEAATPAQPTLCSGKKPGDIIEGRYIVLFDKTKVTSVSQGLYTVQRSLRRQAVKAASATALPLNGTQPTTPALTFQVNSLLTTDAPNLASGTSSAPSGFDGLGRRLQASRRVRRGRPVAPPVLGAVVTVAPGAQGQAVVDSIKGVNTVKDVVPSMCMRVMEDSNSFSCLPATMLSSSIQTPVASAAWAGCLTPNTYLAWWGQRCGPSFSQVQWSGVYAFDKTTGLRLPGCVKQRPSGTPLSADLTFWLGSCGVAPAAVPSLPGMVCRDPYVASTLLSPEEQGCFETNFTQAVQTLQLFHPTPGCGTKQPVSMVFKGARCTGANDSSSGTTTTKPAVVGVLWQTAEPAPGSGLDAAKCSLQRRAEATAEDAIFNMDWFGSCGVPPARAQYATRGECPAPAPPPPPSPSPRPDNQRALDREPVLAGEQIPTGIRRILAATPSANASSGFDTVTIMNPTAVAVIDTGVDCSHRDLNVVFNISFNEAYGSSDPNRDLNGCWDGYDHGTNVAGVIGAKNNGYGVIGVLPNAAIVSLKALTSDGSGPTDNLLKAALWLLSQSLDGVTPNPDNATNAEVLGIDVVNMSLGYAADPRSTFGQTMCDAMQALRNAGIVVVAAAGNDGASSNQAMPGACAGVLSVTALDQGNGTVDVTQTLAYFSNTLYLQGTTPPTENKPNLTIAAPGVDVYSTCFQLQNPYCSLSGTSQATPHVTGMVARCFSGGRCKSRGSGDESTLYAIRKWYEYNLDHEEYGYVRDPIRNPNDNRYSGYLTCADVW